ncbi:MAG: glycine cleavage system aminomethyltransferase GcvT [Sinobacteraceae bacterium]|nr:glycine cleavage system aminomethyltransferase GcvT [Nevskiaceae bacterium]
MLNKTALNEEHRRLGARLVDFAGWEMPLQYASQLEEHHAVRTAAGMFDVAHMAVVDLQGTRALEFLRSLLANDVAKLATAGRALYSCMLNEAGGVLDDLIVYFLAPDRYRLVVNAGTTEKDLAWLRRHATEFEIEVRQRTDLGILAVQGPQARAFLAPRLPAELGSAAAALKPFSAVWDERRFVARTGYTGEDGYELILPHAELLEFWRKLCAAGVRPCGLGARDTLRLEAGMNLYGQDMDESVTPLECGLAWTVAFEPASRNFIGRAALEAQRAAPPRRQIGLVLEGRGVLRAHMPVRAHGALVGEITSGGFAPTMKTSIALARVRSDAAAPYEVEIRGQWQPTREVKPPFVRHGKILV